MKLLYIMGFKRSLLKMNLCKKKGICAVNAEKCFSYLYNNQEIDEYSEKYTFICMNIIINFSYINICLC